MQQKIENLLQELESHTDYTVQAAFRTLDYAQKGYIDGRTIIEFYRRRGIYLLEREACAIVRRVDASCSGRISFADFAEYFQNCVSPKAPLKAPKPPLNPERSP